MLPMATEIDTADVRYYTFKVKEHINADYSPEGMHILAMERDTVASLVQEVVLPPTTSQIQRHLPVVGIANASGIGYLGRVAVDRLELEGFRTVLLDEWQQPRDWSHIIDYTGETKGNPIGGLQRTLRVTDDGVEVQPDPNRQYDFKVILGNQYQFHACTRPVIQPSYDPESEGEDGEVADSEVAD